MSVDVNHATAFFKKYFGFLSYDTNVSFKEHTSKL